MRVPLISLALVLSPPRFRVNPWASKSTKQSEYPLYFDRLRALAKTCSSSKRCVAWMVGQKLLGSGLDGFKDALREGNAELARALREPTAAEAEAIFFDLGGRLGKEGLGLLIFHCPALASFKALRRALESGAPDEALCFLAWKIEEARDKPQLRMPEGDPAWLPQRLALALRKERWGLAKKFLEWSGSLAFERFSPAELAPLGLGPAIRLDGALALTPSDFACLYLQEPFARALAKLGAPPADLAKISALLSAVGKKLPAGQAWALDRQASASALLKSVWREG